MLGLHYRKVTALLIPQDLLRGRGIKNLSEHCLRPRPNHFFTPTKYTFLIRKRAVILLFLWTKNNQKTYRITPIMLNTPKNHPKQTEKQPPQKQTHVH